MKSKSETTVSQTAERDALATKAEPIRLVTAEAEALRQRRAQIAAYI